MRILKSIPLAALVLVSFNANAIPITVGESVRIDWRLSDFIIGGSGETLLSTVATRIGFCGGAPSSGAPFSGDPDCDFDQNGADRDMFRLSIYNDIDQLLFQRDDPQDGGISPNQHANNWVPDSAVAFSANGYAIIEVLNGAFDLTSFLVFGFELNSGIGVQTGLLGIAQVDDGVVQVPEPSTLGLLSLGLIGLGFARRKQAA